MMVQGKKKYLLVMSVENLGGIRGSGRVSRIVRTEEWLKEYGKVFKVGEVALLLGKGMEGVCDIRMKEVGECVVLDKKVVAEKEIWVPTVLKGHSESVLVPKEYDLSPKLDPTLFCSGFTVNWKKISWSVSLCVFIRLAS